jgi:glycosyltransferase involved in cell wall biosynthesis
MKFSVCIPNYNYARYIGETLRSVLVQQADFEVLVADNASSDDSAAVIEAFGDHRIRFRVNATNVGFAGNLDRACAGATGDRMILLSSDDTAEPEALATYERLADALGPAHSGTVFASDQHIIDGDGKRTGRSGMVARLWKDAVVDERLSQAVGARVLRVPAAELLRRSMQEMRTPFAFASTCYPRALYERVEGYGGGYLYNPDKIFAWKVLAVAEEALFVDAPLFNYRVHANNQAAIQARSGALKHLVDQYRLTFDTPPFVLDRAALTSADLAMAFADHDIGLRGLALVAQGERDLARRGLDLGLACYPVEMRRSRRVRQLRALLAMGPVGTAMAGRLYARMRARFVAHGESTGD